MKNYEPNNEILIYEGDNGEPKIEVHIENETVWLNQDQIAELFDKGRSTISEHILNIFREGELDEKVVCRDFRRTTEHGAIKGKTQEITVKHYNLDVIISVGYRVKSVQGTYFRQWATARLREYIVKGFTMDDERLKGNGGGNYWKELLDFFVNGIGIQDGICFNILHYNPRINVDEEYFQKTAKSLIRAFKLFREKGIYEERMMRKAKAFAFKKPIFCDCGVNGGQTVIAPDGKVGVCQDFVKPRKYFGDELTQNPDYDPVESGLYDGWKKRSPFFMEQCYDCEAIALCGGGCPASIELRTGSRWNIDDRICPHSKQSLEWLIWDTYENMNT